MGRLSEPIPAHPTWLEGVSVRKTLMSSWLGVVLVAAALGAMPALTAPAGATGVTVVPLPGDRDGDGVADAADPCPDTVGSPLAADGFAGCLRIDQVVYQVLTGSQVSGQVVPQYGWRGQDVCVAGIKATLRARWYTDHDPATAEGSLTESTTSDANGFFAFDARLPFGTEYSVEVSPRAVVGDEVYCASARTEVYRHVENVGREVVASYQNLTGKVTGRVVVPGDTQVEEPCSDLQTATLLLASPTAPSVAIESTTFLGADETFSIDVGSSSSTGRTTSSRSRSAAPKASPTSAARPAATSRSWRTRTTTAFSTPPTRVNAWPVPPAALPLAAPWSRGS